MEPVRRPVWAHVLPWPISEMAEQQQALTALFGADLHMTQHGQHIVLYTPGEDCSCRRCSYELAKVKEVASGEESWLPGLQMYVCARCGSKRCGQADDHRLACDEDPDVKALFEGPQ